MSKLDLIAEIGKNFIDSIKKKDFNECLGDVERLVHWAKLSNATVVKFQCHVLEDERKKRDESRWSWIRINEEATPVEFWQRLKGFCDWQGVEMLVTPMSKMAAQKVNDLVNRWKVSSADIVDMELLEYLKSTKKPIILSVGMSTQQQVYAAVKFLKKQIQFINYCVSLYPTPIYKIDLSNILKLKEKYGLPVGFSDHSLSIEVPALAVRMGACAVEKHFTLDRNAFGPDHKISLLPDEFKKMVELCKLAETEGESFESEKEQWKTFRINI